MTVTSDQWTLLAAVFGPLATAAGGLLLARLLRPSELITALQEERKLNRDELTALNTRVDVLEAESRGKDDYIVTLRGHITDGKPPPPPPYPTNLLRQGVA